MPLKHSTETTLVAVLGVAMALAGIVVAVLSFVSAPWLLWIAAFFVSVAYPMVLYPHFRERRADYEFRLLHFTPAVVLLVWMLVTIAEPVLPAFAFVRTILTFGWALPLVFLGFVLLAWFCIRVIRQWGRRLGALGLVFVPFAVLGLAGETFEWNRQVAQLLETGTGTTTSSRPIAAESASSGIRITSRGMSSASVGMSVSSKPPHLPHAGGGIEFLAVMVPAATSAAVHLRAMRRNRS